MPLLTVRLSEGATLDDALRQLHLNRADVDTDYGLICLDPDDGLYTLRITDGAATRMSESDSETTVYADPRIEPAGPDSPTGSLHTNVRDQ